ncbi:MAG: TrkA family potassium uptake protein [Candidatus Gygaella obscura]|nr:TrkA family potassium uptake protein [Candidatus Gygaella obscura]
MYIIIVGCGRVGSELARLLSCEGHNVVVVDKNSTAFERLGGAFNGLSLTGNALDVDLLKSAGIEKADVLCALTNGDNTNLVIAQIAKKIFKVAKVLTRIYDPSRAHIYKSLGLDVISGTLLFASMLRDKIIESRLSSFFVENPEMAVLEVLIKDKFDGKNVKAINTPGKSLVTAVIKSNPEAKEKIIIPDDSTSVEKGDIVYLAVKMRFLSEVKSALDI